MLQHVANTAVCCIEFAVCCSVLLFVAVLRSMLQCCAACCSVLQCIPVYSSVLQFQCIAVFPMKWIAVCCSVLQCGAVYCSHSSAAPMMCCSLFQYGTMCLNESRTQSLNVSQWVTNTHWGSVFVTHWDTLLQYGTNTNPRVYGAAQFTITTVKLKLILRYVMKLGIIWEFVPSQQCKFRAVSAMKIPDFICEVRDALKGSHELYIWMRSAADFWVAVSAI